jgi:two-component system sensor histidine kinase and response regulator WspE
MSGIDPTMFELFRDEVRGHADALGAGLVEAEARPTDPALLDGLMRAAHSIKGAARIVNIDTAVRLAHVLEDALVAAQEGKIRLTSADVDLLLRGSDVLAGLAALTPDGVAAWEASSGPAVDALEPQLAALAQGRPTPPAPLPGGRGETELPRAPNVNGARDTKQSDFPLTFREGGPGGVGPPPFEMPAIPDEPFALPPDHSMLDLFREEARESLLAVSKALPHLGSDPTAGDPVQDALKQLRGAARLVKCAPVADAAAALSAFVRAAGGSPVAPAALDWLRYAVATLAGALATDDDSFAGWAESAAPALATAAEALTAAGAARPAPQTALVAATEKSAPPAPLPAGRGETEPVRAANEHDAQDAAEVVTPLPAGRGAGGAGPPASPEPVVRVSARSLNRLMGLAGESLVQARWLPSFSAALLKLKRQHDRLATLLDAAHHAAAGGAPPDQLAAVVADTRREWGACRQELAEKAAAFDDHAARAEDLNARLYREVIVSRMRPFGDGLHGLPRMARDVARSLGKEARLVVVGETTEVDRDVLEKLEAPLSHLIRNAIDHGLETPDRRRAAEKPAAGTITVEARHRAGMLLVTVSDDGAGVDLDRLRAKVVARGLNTAEMAARSTEAELLEFLFLPGFSTAPAVTELSGRGVGLDVVMDTARKVGGNVRITTARGKGTTFHLQLPLTLSVIRAVVIDVAGEPYAFPHTRIDRLIRVRRDEVRSIEHRQFVTVDEQNVGLVMAAQLLDMPAAPPTGADVPVVLLSDGTGTYGLVVDAFRGEQDLVVRPLDPRLGKVPNLSAAAIWTTARRC